MLEKITTEYAATIDSVRNAINEMIGLNKKAQSEADKTGKAIDDGFVKGSNGAKRFNDELKRTARTQAELELKVRNLQELLRDDTKLGSSAFRKVQAEIKKTEAELDKLNGKAKEVPGTFREIGSMVVAAFSVQAVISFTKELVKTQREAEILANQFAFVSGGAEAGRAAFNRLQKTAQELGLDFQVLSEEYVKFANAARVMGMSNEQALQVFENMSLGLRGAGASAQQQQRAFLALTQIMSKGRLMGQELTLQLGNALPGAVGIAAKAMGVTTSELNKMMQEGQVLADDFVPKFAAAVRDNFAGALAGKKDSLDAAANRATNSIEKWKRAVLDGTSVAKNFADAVSTVFDRQSIILQAQIPWYEKLGRSLADVTGLYAINQNLLQKEVNLQAERQKNQESINKAIQEEANRIFNLDTSKRDSELATLQMQKTDLENRQKKRGLMQAEQRDYDQIAGVISSVAQLQQAADQKKAAAALKDEEQQKRLLELQKKRDKELQKYIDNIKNSVRNLKALEEREIRNSENTKKLAQEAVDWQKNKEKESLDGRKRFFQSYQDDLDRRNKEGIATSQQAIEDADNREKAMLDQKAQAYRDFYSTIQGLANDFLSYQLQLVRSETQTRIDSLRFALDTNRISEEEYNARVIELKRQQFEREKSIARGQALINGALAATNILANWAGKNPIIAAALLGLTAVSVGAQIATINAQTPGFKDGVIDLQGPGTSTSDSIVARLSKGESVMTAAETRQHRDELMAIRNGTFDDLVIEKYIAPALIEQKQKQNGFAENFARAIKVQSSFDDTEMIHAIRRNRVVKLHPESIEAMSSKKISKAESRRKW